MLSACPPCVTWRQIHRERETLSRVYGGTMLSPWPPCVRGREIDSERAASACIRRHQDFALAPEHQRVIF